MSQTLVVHVRVNEASTGRPTPVRLRIGGPGGEYLPPLGHSIDFPIGRNEDVGRHVYLDGKRHAYIDGTCEISLPTGVPLTVEISKGPAYVPIRQTVTLGEGQLSLRFAVHRWTGDSWTRLIAADSRCHFLTPHSARLEAQAEGLDLVNLLATVQDYPSQDGHMYRVIPNMEAFSGPQPAIESVFVNTFNTHPALGRLALLNCHRAVFPLTFGQIDETDDWSLSNWCEQCHRKKGLVVWCDAYRPEAGLAGGEALVNAILGKVDAIEMDARDRSAPFLPHWYRLLNAGLRLPIVGGSGKDSNRIALGSVRTLTPISESQSYSEWIEAVRSGQGVATNGPLLRLFVDDVPFTTQVRLDPQRRVRLRAEAASIMSFERLEIVANGTPIASAGPTGEGIMTATLEMEWAMPEGGWVAARCWGTGRQDPFPNTPMFAHTSPTWIEVPNQALPRSPAAVAALRREVEAVRDWIASHGRFQIARRQEQQLTACDLALARLDESG